MGFLSDEAIIVMATVMMMMMMVPMMMVMLLIQKKFFIKVEEWQQVCVLQFNLFAFLINSLEAECSAREWCEIFVLTFLCDAVRVEPFQMIQDLLTENGIFFIVKR